MKTRSILLSIIVVFTVSSCIIRSLYPFYTKDTIYFEERFLGTWEGFDGKPNKWIVVSVEDVYHVQNALDMRNCKGPLCRERITTEIEAYFLIIKVKDEIAIYLMTPFKIKNDLFLDVFPINNYCSDGSGNGCEMKEDFKSFNIKTHSLLKLDVLNNDTVKMHLFDKFELRKLIENNKIKIKYHKIEQSDGTKDNLYLLTASSVELQRFIEKFIRSKEFKEDYDIDDSKLNRIKNREDTFEFIKNIIAGNTPSNGIRIPIVDLN
ncbi:hypothetical protein [Tamlana flava]|uniref:hypothetical protein n=1 Tax=Tamlana flava TaxID=3158572 RepID=UPI00351BCF8F